jgi:uncharacterized membrane protein YgdD (TMEM256/DUF423 family)
MIDRESKMFMMFAGILLLVFVVIGAFGIANLEQRIDHCSAAGGMLVKSTDGWKCIEAKQIT